MILDFGCWAIERGRCVFQNPLVLASGRRAYASESGMDDLFLKRVLFEWLRDRKKEQALAEIVSLNIL
jgi:hypothetical protein